MQEPSPAVQHRHTIVVVGTRDLEATVLRRQLEDIVDILAFVPQAEQAIDVIRDRSPALVVLFLDHDRDGVLTLARRLAAVDGLPSIMVSRDRNPDNILLAMRSGVRDFAFLEGEDNDVRRAIKAIAGVPAVVTKRRGQVIATFGCKGGSGATTIATNLAGALLEAGAGSRRVALLDLDVQMGDVLVFLDLASRYSWADLLRNLHRHDDELVHRSLTTHASGLRVIAQSGQLEESDDIDAAAVTRTLDFLRQHYDYIVVDGVRNFSEHALAALDAADRVLLTMTQDIPALKNANRCLGVFQRLGYGRDKLKLVLNRYHKREKLDLDAISDALGAAIDGTVANDFQTVIRSINEGVLLVKSAPRARVTKDVRAMLPALGLTTEPTDDGGKRGLFGRKR